MDPLDSIESNEGPVGPAGLLYTDNSHETFVVNVVIGPSLFSFMFKTSRIPLFGPLSSRGGDP